MQTMHMNGPMRRPVASVFGVIAAALLAIVSSTAPAAVVDIDQIPARDQLLRQMGNLADIQPGVTALESGDYVAAARLARGYIGRNPTDSKSHLLLVLAWYGQKDDGRIDSHLAEVDGKLPALGASLRETVAGLYLRDGRLYRAGRQLESIPVPRRTDQSEFLTAAIAGRQGNVAEARSRIDKLAVKLPDNVPLAINQSRLALMATDNDAAAAAASRALKSSPDLEAALLLQGTARMQQGRPAEALKSFNTILARNPAHGPSALSVGLIHLAGGRNAEAIKAFRSARSLGAGDARPFFAEATAALVAGDAATAKTASAAARKQNPEDPMAALVDVLVRGPAAQAKDGSAARNTAGQFFPDLRRAPLPAAIAAEISDPKSARRLAVANVLAHTWSGQAALDWLGPTAASDGAMITLTRARALASAGRLDRLRERAHGAQEVALGRRAHRATGPGRRRGCEPQAGAAGRGTAARGHPVGARGAVPQRDPGRPVQRPGRACQGHPRVPDCPEGRSKRPTAPEPVGGQPGPGR